LLFFVFPWKHQPAIRYGVDHMFFKHTPNQSSYAIQMQVFKALLHGSEPVAVKCIGISSPRGPVTQTSSDSQVSAVTAVHTEGEQPSDSSRSESVASLNGGEKEAIVQVVDHFAPESLVPAAARRARYAHVGQLTTPQHKILQEISLLKAFRSQYVVSFLGACFQDAEVLLVTELMPGGDLWTALREERISWRRG
jgi:hypothetical protein